VAIISAGMAFRPSQVWSIISVHRCIDDPVAEASTGLFKQSRIKVIHVGLSMT
jgi:hypothetical protein